MGYTKQLMKEQESKKFKDTELVCCSRCFDDPDITKFLQDHLCKQRCDFCDSDLSVPTSKLSDVLTFIIDCIEKEYRDPTECDPIEVMRDRDYPWLYEIVDELIPNINYKLLSEIRDLTGDLVYTDDTFSPTDSSFNQDILSDLFASLSGGRSSYPKELHDQLFDAIHDYIMTFNLFNELDDSQRLFRIRSNFAGPNSIQETCIPPQHIRVKFPTRFAKAHSSALYVSTDLETAKQEISLQPNEQALSVTLRAKSIIKLIDFSKKLPYIGIFDANNTIRQAYLFLDFLKRELIKHVDKKIPNGYLPYQLIAERIYESAKKVKPDVQGIKYNSSKNTKGENIVFFIKNKDISEEVSDVSVLQLLEYNKL